MSTITMHGVDEVLDQRVREIARNDKASINQTVQTLLRKALGLDKRCTDHRAQFQDFAGKWSQAELDEFEALTATCSKIDVEDWK